jgi:hypothetical protein
METFIINLSGEITEVYPIFFINQIIIRENKVGDTHFITIENGTKDSPRYTLTYSIHEDYYNKIKPAIRNYKIDKILK